MIFTYEKHPTDPDLTGFSVQDGDGESLVAAVDTALGVLAITTGGTTIFTKDEGYDLVENLLDLLVKLP